MNVDAPVLPTSPQSAGVTQLRSRHLLGIAGMDGQQLYLNPAGLRILGIADMAEALGSSNLEYFAPEDRPFVENTIIPAVTSAGR